MKLLVSLFLSLFLLQAQGQVARNILLEHFTNTRCGICGSRNPALKSNLAANPEVISISFHPSSPYSNCFLNNHNPAENDERTNFYGLYGSTPKITIQGESQGSVNFGSAAIFDSYRNEMSLLSIGIDQKNYSDSLITATIVIKREASGPLSNQTLHVFLIEDSVFYDAPNGEDLHLNVFRKRLLAATGENISIPAATGDSLVRTVSTSVDAAWNIRRMKVVAVVQSNQSDLSIEQAAVAEPKLINPPSGMPSYSKRDIILYPNPSKSKIQLEQLQAFVGGELMIYEASGRFVSQQIITANQITVELNARGIYFLQLIATDGTELLKKVVISE